MLSPAIEPEQSNSTLSLSLLGLAVGNLGQKLVMMAVVLLPSESGPAMQNDSPSRSSMRSTKSRSR